MPFYLTASAPLLGVYQSSGKFTKCAAQQTDIPKADDEQVKRAINLISKDVLKSIAKVYNLSDNVNNYIFPITRTVTANVPNGNGDRFTSDELTRFSSQHRCRVFETFRNDPLHVEHAADDPKTARGFLPDVYYMNKDAKDMHVLAVAAVDVTKDSPLAEGILSGDINSFSMGCICEAVKCSYSKCKKPTAYSDAELCDHLKFSKMASIEGELIYEDCMGVEFQELSVVGTPADPTARTQAILQFTARKQAKVISKSARPLITQLLQDEDQEITAHFFKHNIGHLPEAMVRLAHKLFSVP
jgi:hypothetical protein